MVKTLVTAVALALAASSVYSQAEAPVRPAQQEPSFCKSAMDPTRSISDRISDGVLCKHIKAVRACSAMPVHEAGACFGRLNEDQLRRDWMQELQLHLAAGK